MRAYAPGPAAGLYSTAFGVNPRVPVLGLGPSRSKRDQTL